MALRAAPRRTTRVYVADCRIEPSLDQGGTAARRRGPAPAPTSGLGEAPVGCAPAPTPEPPQINQAYPGAQPVLAEAVFLGRPVSSSRTARQGRSLRSRRFAIGWRRP